MIFRNAAVCIAIALLAACSRPDPAALVSAAKEHMAKREYSAAIIQFKNALKSEPGNTEARYLLGVASLENDDLVSAEIELNNAKQSGYGEDELEVALARTMF